MNASRTKRFWRGPIASLMLLPGVIWGQLRIVPAEQPLAVFSGERRLGVTLQNPDNKTIEADLRTRLYQTGSATAIQLSEPPWKKLQVLAGQTILDSAGFSFPMVRAETRFLIQWLVDTNRVIGTTEVLVYPPDLLKELKPLTGDEALGVFDADNQLKPLLKSATVDFLDLEDAGLENFRGKLAIVGPFQSKTQMRDGLAEQIQKLAWKGVAVVWILPPPEKRDKLTPSFYVVPAGSGSVVIVQAGLISNLSESPKAQLNLIQFARLALQPEPARLPYLNP